MEIIKTDISDVFCINPQLFGDERGYFFEGFNKKRFAELTQLDVEFVQDNQSSSMKNTLRGLHYQIETAQDKLVRVLSGEIFDVAVDLRKDSASFGQWVGVILSAENKRQIWVPKGFAHGFCVLSDTAEVFYKTTNYYAPEHERCLKWDDPELAIDWPIDGEPILSDKDKMGLPLSKVQLFS